MVTYRKQIAVKGSDEQIIKVPIKGEEAKMISATKVKWTLRMYLQRRIFWSRHITLWDPTYELVDESKLNLQPVPHLPRGADCDDYAVVMWGELLKRYPKSIFGICEGYNKNGERHVWCYFISTLTHTFKGKGIRGYSPSVHIVKYVEPKTAQIFLPSAEKVYTFLR